MEEAQKIKSEKIFKKQNLKKLYMVAYKMIWNTDE